MNGYTQTPLYTQPAIPIQISSSPSRAGAQSQSLRHLSIPQDIKPSTPALLTPPYSTTDARKIVPTAMKKESPLVQNSRSKNTTPVSMSGNEPQLAAATAAATSAKPKRVRTGCLTCRERHLKCDEGLPNCQNCKKSNRTCKRGVRLNFIDTQVQRPPTLLSPTHDWKVVFQDDSRDIASEYQGGVEKYTPIEPSPKRRRMTPPEVDYNTYHVQAPVMTHQQIPQQPYQNYGEVASAMYASTGAPTYEDQSSAMAHSMSSYSDQHRPSYDQTALMMAEQPGEPPYLTDRDELFYMQVFVEEVGIWMDSMDADKHFSGLLPFQALRTPMLKHALLACGVRHLTLINTAYADADAIKYYNMATNALLKQLQNPDRDTVLCATTATVLNVYEVMSEKALQRMNHIAGARALIKECRWDATSTGIASACFWLNVGLELFSCLHFNWGVAWDPDTWGLDMNMTPQPVGGNEEDWTHKIVWILAKITNYRSQVPKFQEPSVHAEQLRLHQRHQQWLGLKQFCDKWHACVPLTMHPIACIQPSYPSRSASSFPEVWYIKRTTVVARLFYHTAMALLGSVHPMAEIDPQISEEMREMRTYHSRQICGIVKHVKDRGVASASIRCLAIAGEHLSVRREQEEVLDIFDKIKKETGWRVAFINDNLREKWGWSTPNQNPNANGGASTFYPGGNSSVSPAIPPRPKYPSGIKNPLYINADFGSQNPPYQGSYVPPNMAAATGAHLLHGGSVAQHAAQAAQAQAQAMYGFSGIPAM